MILSASILEAVVCHGVQVLLKSAIFQIPFSCKECVRIYAGVSSRAGNLGVVMVVDAKFNENSLKFSDRWPGTQRCLSEILNLSN
jgi:hypothetical protein